MEKAIFRTKFDEDMDRNNQIVTVINKVDKTDMYLIEFDDKKQLIVYDTELKFLEGDD